MKVPIQTKVVHSESKSAWNIIGVKPGGKYKIARVPYIVVDHYEITEANKKEALEHAEFISFCFNSNYNGRKSIPPPPPPPFYKEAVHRSGMFSRKS